MGPAEGRKWRRWGRSGEKGKIKGKTHLADPVDEAGAALGHAHGVPAPEREHQIYRSTGRQVQALREDQQRGVIVPAEGAWLRVGRPIRAKPMDRGGEESARQVGHEGAGARVSIESGERMRRGRACWRMREDGGGGL